MEAAIDVPLKTTDELIQDNLRLVLKIANEYVGRGLAWDDIVSEGNLGLVKAARKFDQTRGTKFSTYCAYWIKQSIQQAIADQRNAVRTPVGSEFKRRAVWRTVNKLTRELGRTPTDDEVAKEAALPLLTVRRLRGSAPVEMISLNAPVSEEDPQGTEQIELFSDETDSAPDEKMIAVEDIKTLFALLGKLSPRDRKVLELRFGLNGEPVQKLDDIARQMNCSNERVRQIQNRALKKLQTQLKESQ